MDFTAFEVHRCPPTAMYIPNFITYEEEQQFLSNVARAPKPKWTQLMNRRVINYGGVPHTKGMLAEEIPAWLQSYVDKINNLGIFAAQKANHVLVNEYLPGQGIMPHTDGPLFHPLITTISCGSHTVLEFIKHDRYNEDDDEAPPLDGAMRVGAQREVLYKLLLEPRSLLILKDDLYSKYLHSISALHVDMLCDRVCNYKLCSYPYKIGDRLERSAPRISLTIRNVPKTTRLKLKF